MAETKFTATNREGDRSQRQTRPAILGIRSRGSADSRRAQEPFGELMKALSDSYENRRALQAAEWEALRRNTLRSAS